MRPSTDFPGRRNRLLCHTSAAETVGVEPTWDMIALPLSKRAQSASLAHLHGVCPRQDTNLHDPAWVTRF